MQKQVFHYVQQEEEEKEAFSVKEIDKKLRPEKDDFLCTEELKTTTLMIMMMNIHILDVCSKIVGCRGGHKRLGRNTVSWEATASGRSCA